ncbi:MAG: T9SS type A sorting domain-containing protein [Ignavibacteriales bacterium]|nr:T9SS type A sorting domain-containing protein [Ignavibacteriales bacterium]
MLKEHGYLSPFNDDWTSSIFLSQDMVAIESVAYDFLSAEYNGSFTNSKQKVSYPLLKGTTDYLRQAASSEYWPEGISYDPENDGIPINSLGVNEHWNNKIDKQYSRNLGYEEGIELIFIDNNLKVLNAPTNVTLELVNQTDVKLIWQDNSNNEDGFLIEWKDTVSGSNYEIIDSVGANEISYIDTTVKMYPSYIYRIAAFNNSGYSNYSDPIIITDIIITDIQKKYIVNDFRLYQNYPNPFNPSTTISYSIPEKQNVTIKIFDITGSEITLLKNKFQQKGSYEINFDGSDLTSGIYFYTLQAGNFSKTKKMILLK